jgi:hypothetical protein
VKDDPAAQTKTAPLIKNSDEEENKETPKQEGDGAPLGILMSKQGL